MPRSSPLGRVDLALLLVAVLWGFNMPVMKLGMAHMPPLAFNWLRFAMGVPCAWGLLLGTGGRTGSIAPGDWRALVKVALGFFCFIACFTLGLSRTTAGNTAILMGMLPLGVALWNRILGVESLSRRMVLGILLSLLGALVVVLGTGKEVSFKTQHITGDLIVMAGVLANGYFLAGSKPLTARYPAGQVATWCFTISFMLLTPFSAPSLLRVPWHALGRADWLAAFYCGPLALTITNFLWIWGVSRIGSTRTSVYNNLPPIFAIAGGVAFLGESFGPVMLAGTVVILAGVYLCRTGAPGARRATG
ncbi:MAG TPA: DMT family transporter [Holophaga sp.]|nr:DMT family transporter [Holophaga sp.]